MHPKARISNIETRKFSQSLLVVDLARECSHELDSFHAFIWEKADGSRSVGSLLGEARLAVDPLAMEAHVWAALDTLTEMGLMESRVAPPAGQQRIGRRDMVRKFATTGVAAMFGLAAAPAIAQSEQEAKKSAETEAKKSTEEKAKASDKAAAAAEQEKKAAGEKADKQAEIAAKRPSEEVAAKQAAESARKDLEKLQAEQNAKSEAQRKQAEEENSKGIAQESRIKVDSRASEQKAKLNLASQEQKEKSAAREQEEKASSRSAEESAKLAVKARVQAEQGAKSSAEQAAKNSSEQLGKNAQEETSKERAVKNSAEQSEKLAAQERADKSSNEESSKEAEQKLGDNITVISVDPAWQNVGQGYERASFFKQGGVCVLGGLVHRALLTESLADGVLVGTLPPGARPARRRVFNAWARFGDEFGSARVDVLPDGRFMYVGAAKGQGWLSLDGIVFSAHTA